MKRLLAILSITGLLGVLSPSSSAQCAGARYRDFLFQDSVQSNIIYGHNFDYNTVSDTLKLDIHFPQSDPNPHNRPLIIFAHSGYFVQGDKTDQDVVQLCQAFSRMGYVTASINYRVGMDNYPYPSPDTLTSTRALIRGVQDGRAAVRFFRNSYANGNPYGIDTSNIFFGGTSVGAMVALHLAYLDRMSDFPLWCDTTKSGMGGGLQGLSGSAFYSATTTPIPSTVKAVINICGAILDTSWIHPGGIPLISFHGDSDKTIPYDQGAMLFQTAYKLQVVQGGHAIMRRANNIGLVNCFDEYIGQDHLPEVNPLDPGPAYLDTTLNMTRNFLVHFTCGDPLVCTYTNPFVLGIKEQAQKTTLHCYPNPATSTITVDMGEANEPSELTLYNSMGQELRHYSGVRDSQFTLERGNLASGLYLLVVDRNGKRIQVRIVFN
jgi:hypothetical protein